MKLGFRFAPCFDLIAAASIMVGESETKTSLRIILIDDDPFDVKLIEATLRASLNCHVSAVDSKAALLAYRDNAYARLAQLRAELGHAPGL